MPQRRLVAAQLAVSDGRMYGTRGPGDWFGTTGGGIGAVAAAGAACLHGGPAPRQLAVLDVRAGRQG